MDNQYVAQAQAAYAAKDFSTALNLYNQFLQDQSIAKEPGDVGYVYHQMGNCYMQMNAFAEAVHVYTQATADAAYDASGAVNCNLAKAYAALHDYEHAIAHFEAAASDPKYDARHKAYMGMGNAYMKIGKNAEAGISFREAALDAANPDPTKALLNLGVCFMALDRPMDAVQSYESALRFNMDPFTRNKMYANLGQAYVASGQMQQAMSAFEAALEDKTYFLSDSASVDYSRAATAVATGTASLPDVAPEMGQDMSGLDVTNTTGDALAPETMDPYEADPQYYPAEAYGYDADDSYANSEERFLYASNEELEAYSKGIARQDRKRRNFGLKIVLVIIALLLALAGAGVFMYAQGYGYPTQEMVVSEVFANPEKGAGSFAENIDKESVESALSVVVPDKKIAIDGVDMSVSSSTAYVTAHTEEGGEVSYKVDMVRDLLSWKVSNIELLFDSQQ